MILPFAILLKAFGIWLGLCIIDMQRLKDGAGQNVFNVIDTAKAEKSTLSVNLSD